MRRRPHRGLPAPAIVLRPSGAVDQPRSGRRQLYQAAERPKENSRGRGQPTERIATNFRALEGRQRFGHTLQR